MPEPPDLAPQEPGEPGAYGASRVGPRDPFAVALGNASLLGIGYVLLGRRGLAVVSVLVSAALLVVLASADGAGWFQGVVFAWWAALVVHGFSLASRSRARPSGVRGQRLVAAAVAVPVLATFVVVRVDAARVENAAEEAHRAGECERVLSMVDGLGPGHRLADAPLVDRAKDGADACALVVRARRQAKDDRLLAVRTLERYQDHRAARWAGATGYRGDLLLDQAAADLHTGLAADTGALTDGFTLLAKVRRELPGRGTDAGGVLDDFLAGLPVEDPCVTAEITDWIAGHKPRGAELDRAAEVLPRVAPAAIVGCADAFMAKKNPAQARPRYQQLVTEYPRHALLARAKKGVVLATQAIELADVRARLATTAPDTLPHYCDKTGPYSAAKPYRGRGPHRALIYGQDFQRRSLPAPWRAKDAADAVLVICAGESVLGDGVQTCPYEPQSGTSLGFPISVTFHKRKIPVRVYEVRTGRLVANTSVQIGGASCPNVLNYEYYVADLGPPSDVYVTSSTSDIVAAYKPVIDP
ncbi:hypothetical protein [Actinophytocola sp.]|uniref:tetratricopeptide repeat protein n=1 Tax=Actinophytocola sp. TaxID=1872138 RepID=UPI002ED85F29